jgi:hypothetical protein
VSWLALLSACGNGPAFDSRTGIPGSGSTNAGSGASKGPDAGLASNDGALDAGADGFVNRDAGAVSAGATLTEIQGSIFSQYCVSCHAGPDAVAAMDLSTRASAYESLVGVHAGGPKSECAASGLLRVDPGQAGRSLLYLKIGPSPPCGGRMPDNAPPLSDDEIGAVEAWINAGAPND